VLVLVLAAPLLYSLTVSFFDTSLKVKGLGSFVGLSNYIDVLQDEYFIGSALTTLFFTVGVVFFEFIFGLIIALLLNNDIKGKNIFFSIIIVPMMITPIAVGLTWRLLLHSNLGIVNYALSLIGITGKAWLADPSLALGTVIFIDVWQQIPYMVLIILAGLVTLPVEPYEAVLIDGATRIQTFFRLTVPLMMPTFAVVILLRSITALKTYDLIYVLTKGGPGTSTEVISYHIYQQAFRYLEIGTASAMSYLLLIFIVPLAFVFILLAKNRMN
ncbi:MAG TPA: sugar ABC transporter permease, partial [Anaerovoracaceae bacterium]|nr:sugar ABC transporter permease [Anaerovoracaceae bacterium]